MEFSDKLKKLRSEKGISQKRLADAIFVSRSAVAKWENGLGVPSEESYEALIRYFGVSKEFFKTEEPEVIILEKNKKIRRRSISMRAAIAIIMAFFAAYILYRPVPFYVSASCDRIEVQLTAENMTFAITEKKRVEELIDLLNSMSFRKALRLSNEAPDNLQAVFYIRGDGGMGDDIWLCPTPYGAYSVHVWTGSEELIARDPEALSGYMVQLIENEGVG